MQKTNFQKVQEFNRAFDMAPKHPSTYESSSVNDCGVLQHNAFIHIRPELFINEPRIIKLRLDLIDEEIKELHEAITNNDIIETRDALADILYVVYGMADVLGINIDTYFNTYFFNILDSTNIDNTHKNIKNKNNMKLINDIYKDTEDNTNNSCKCNCVFNSVENKNKNNKNNNEKCNTQHKELNISNFDKIQILLECCPDTLTNINCYNKHFIQDNLQIIQKNISFNYKKLETYCLEKNNDVDIKKFNIITSYINNILIYVYSYTYILEYNSDIDFTIVHNSNMSKLCDSQLDAENTVIDYINRFKLGDSPYNSPYYYELPELNKWIVKNKSTGKALKNIKYHKVVFM